MRQPTKRRHAEERSRVGAIPPRHAQQTNEHLRRASSDPCGAKQRSPNAQGKVEGWLGMWGEGGAVTEGGKGRKGARKLCEKGVGNIPPKHASGFVGPLWKQPTKRRRTRQGRGGSGYVGNGRCGEKGGGERVRGKRAGIVGKAGRREERGKGDVRSPASGRHARTPDRKAPAPVPETMAWPEAPGSHDHPPPWESRVPEPEFRKNDGSGFRKNGLVQFRKNPKRGSGKTGPRAVPEKWPSSGKGVSSLTIHTLVAAQFNLKIA